MEIITNLGGYLAMIMAAFIMLFITSKIILE